MTPQEVSMARQGMAAILGGALDECIKANGSESINFLAGVIGRAFAPYLDSIEKVDVSGTPPLLMEWHEAVRAVAADVREQLLAERSGTSPFTIVE